ncbi:MAG: STAS domain-containing protein [Acidimicrobiales bacterium]
MGDPGRGEVVDLTGGGFLTEIAGTDDAYAVALHGELHPASAGDLAEVLVAIPGAIVVELGGLTFVDAPGLSALLVARTRTTSAGNRFRIQGARGLVRRAFEPTDPAGLLDDG